MNIRYRWSTGWLWSCIAAVLAILVILIVYIVRAEQDPMLEWPMVNDALSESIERINGNVPEESPFVSAGDDQGTEDNADNAELNVNPTKDEGGEEEPAPADDGRISINRADSQQLQQLPGIGPSKAQAIIDYREEVGRFVTIDQIMDVKGIGPKTFSKIQDQIRVD